MTLTQNLPTRLQMIPISFVQKILNLKFDATIFFSITNVEFIYESSCGRRCD